MHRLPILVLFCLAVIFVFAESVPDPGTRFPAFDPDAFEPDNSATQFTNLSISFYEQHALHTLHSTTDQDWFRFYGETGKTYHFHSTGSIDDRIFIYNDAATSIVASDDDSGENNNFLLSISVPASGFYKVKIDGYSGAMGAYSFYYWWEWPPDPYEPDNSSTQFNFLMLTPTLQSQSHSIHSNTDQDWYKFSARRGKTYTFYSSGSLDTQGVLYSEDGSTQMLIDDDGAGYPNFRIQFTAGVTEVLYLKVMALGGLVGDYQLHYNYGASVDGYEPDDTVGDPTILDVLTVLQDQNHSFHSITDLDWFRFQGVAGRVYHFISTGDTDTRIYLSSADGVTQIANDDDSNGYPNFHLVFVPTITAQYSLKVMGYDGDIGYYGFNYFYNTSLPGPENVTISRTGTTININWDAVLGAATYVIEVSGNPYSGFQPIGATTTTQWSVISSEPKIFIRIRASSSSEL